jgi:DNA-binding MarR family transcriptional regulator
MRTISEGGRLAGPDGDARRLQGMLAELMRRRSLRDPISATCAELELSAPQVHTLLALGHEGPLTMGDLARRVAVTEKTTTGLVDRLERDGLVLRLRDGADRRVVRVKLTAHGARLARRLDAEVLEKLTWMMGRLDAGDRRDLFRIIGKLTDLAEEQNP